jgi:lysozyme
VAETKRAHRPEGNTLRISEAGLKLIAKFEGCVLSVYKDAAGLDTIGIGHLIKPGETFASPFTVEEAENLLRKDAADAESAVTRSVTALLNQNQIDACISLAFNIGGGGFARSSLVKAINEQRFDDCPKLFLLWNKAGGKVLDGLTSRRAAEAALFATPFDAAIDASKVLASVYEMSAKMVGELVGRDLARSDTDGPPPDDAA